MCSLIICNRGKRRRDQRFRRWLSLKFRYLYGLIARVYARENFLISILSLIDLKVVRMLLNRRDSVHIMERATLESILKHEIVKICSDNWILINFHRVGIVSLVIKALFENIFGILLLTSELWFWVVLWFLTGRCSNNILLIIIAIRRGSPVLTHMLICILIYCWYRLQIAVWLTIFASIKGKSHIIVCNIFLIYDRRGIWYKFLSRIIMIARIYLLTEKLFQEIMEHPQLVFLL